MSPYYRTRKSRISPGSRGLAMAAPSRHTMPPTPPPSPPPPPPTSQKNDRITFFHLPLEMRREVYSYFVRNKAVNVYTFHNEVWSFFDDRSSQDQRTISSLLLVSKQIYTEASELLYFSTVFEVMLTADTGYYCLKVFNQATLNRIRRLQIVLRPSTCFYSLSTSRLNLSMWSPLLAQLTHLTVAAQQPLHPRPYYENRSLEEDVARWVKWIAPIMKPIGQGLQARCVVTVDHDNKEETKAVMEEAFPNGFRQVETRAGKFCFERGEYSLEFGYGQNVFWNASY